MTSPDTTREAAAGRARRAVAAKLSRPFSDVDAKAAEILDALHADGWRPPQAASDSGPPAYRRERVPLASEAHAAATAERLRAELAEARQARVEAADAARQGGTDAA